MVGQVIDVRLAFPSLGVVREGNHGTDDFPVPELGERRVCHVQGRTAGCPEHLVIHVETSSSPECGVDFTFLELHEPAVPVSVMDQEMHIPAGQILKTSEPKHAQAACVREGAAPVPVDAVYAFRGGIQDQLQVFPVVGQLPVSLPEFSGPLFHDVLQGGKQGLQPFGHAVEGRGHQPDFVVSPHLRPPGEVPR